MDLIPHSVQELKQKEAAADALGIHKSWYDQAGSGNRAVDELLVALESILDSLLIWRRCGLFPMKQAYEKFVN